MNLIEELRWRGMVQDMMPGTEEQLQKEMTTGYVGFDPTADSLHIGNLVPIMLLKHLQRAGHKPLALVGGATGMVGDPSFKAEERKMLDEETLQHNQRCIKAQLEKYLDFDPAKPNAAEMVNNYDWFKNISFLHFIRDVGKHITVNYMMAKDSVKKRIEGDNGMSFTEFSYQLIQGYDYYHLYNEKNCRLQMGGSDQWGNIVTGTEMIRRKGGGEAFAFTCPLVKKADGTKFGKSEKGNIWLDASKTTPYEFYQFWLRCTDEDAEQWIKTFTFLDQNEISSIIAEHNLDKGKYTLQKRLAQEVTAFIHGQQELELAMMTTDFLFGKLSLDALKSLSDVDVKKVMAGVQQATITKAELAAGIDVLTFMTNTQIFPSKGEARKMLQNGGLSINTEKVTAQELVVDSSFLWNDKYILVAKGKKNYVLVTAE
ncbi:tyrosyl-tRNA synthetase [Chitinophaga skermanii]|uniref:Tyrosine--tRNA ligase n=1 Tax=Chitinophaga skermanii TaxID=331697 RepID=A0A327RAP3_9BACT|nr:tyrosine--tRNA ligase [Chitinophaga skermanii]RAJ10997.1 tyrosyl-tRNA synthetase [Chitinophaga skermanii]